MLVVAGIRKMIVKHIDIKTAFLYGEINENIYMKQPEGYIQDSDNKVCKLNKSIYGLKQSARVWNDKINNVLCSFGFRRGLADPCLYSKMIDGKWTFVLIYVDDIIVASELSESIISVEKLLSDSFEIKILGEISNFLGIEVHRNKNGIFCINQERYIDNILNKFSMQDSKPSKIPMDPGYYKLHDKSKQLERNDEYRAAIGSLLYLSVNTRPDIAASVGILSRKVCCPSEVDWVEVKRILRYLKGTKSYCPMLGNLNHSENQTFYGYADADWAECTDDRKSNTGFLFKLFGGTISWASRKQTCVTLSSTEAEYVALSEACQELKWLKLLLLDFNEFVSDPTVIYEDNQSCLKIVDNEKIGARTKHIDVKFHFAREMKSDGGVIFEYCPSSDMVADMLTKPLANVKIKRLSVEIGLMIRE